MAAIQSRVFQQEQVLGIAGWRLLRALGIKPEVCHLNEGHAAFAVLERARSLHGRYKAALRRALSKSRAPAISSLPTRPSQPDSTGFRPI